MSRPYGYYEGLCVGGPLDGQYVAKPHESFEAAVPMPLMHFKMGDLPVDLDEPVERTAVRYTFRPWEVECPRYGKREHNLWVPDDLMTSWAVERIMLGYVTSASFRRTSKAQGSSVTELRVVPHRRGSDYVVLPMMSPSGNMAYSQDLANQIAIGLVTAFPDKYVLL